MKKLLALLLCTLLVVSVMAPIALAADDGFVDGKFTQTRTITVEIFDRNTEGAVVDDNAFTDYIKENMLNLYNVEVVFQPTPRWTEGDDIANYLAAGTASDISYTYNDGAIHTYFLQDAVLDLQPLLDEYKDYLPDLYAFLGSNLTWKTDPYTGQTECIVARRMNVARINTFVRKDWLDKLGMEVPTTTQEFEDMLYAFKDNAELLLGEEADKMIPYSMTDDVGWRANNILYSFVPDEFTTDKYNYIYNDDRQFLLPGVKEAVRMLNKWYNDGLILQDFSLYAAGDATEYNLLKAGYVGAVEVNWDDVYRNAEESVHYMLQQAQGEDAVFVAIDPFKNDAGLTKKVNYSANDRWIFFPSTNTEPLASLLYLNWMSKFENRFFLQTGVEGINHEFTEDGTLKAIAPESGPYKMSSSNNIDMTMIINGLDLGDTDKTAASMALGYAYVAPELIKSAYATALTNGVSYGNINLGAVEAAEGITTVLADKRDVILNTAINASVEDFDAVWDAGMEDYMASGGQAILDERMAKYEAAFGE
ncbi:MAG TPA: sugar ABC transporter substrate-binding protein [Candidatus Limiplasma sp.]|nr:sugar ABC transporter substrate-binding protein [Candidatus Limiplasma sp.]HRX08468.1 sugar ABC transporter substrate-binding protein [Candidatus Limiplasma sp.]